jgi:hypothetical protein
LSARNKRKEKLETVINGLSEGAAKKLLLRLGLEDKEVETEIRIEASKDSPSAQLQQWRKKLSRLPDLYGDRWGFIDYHNAYDYTSELESIVSRAVPDFLETGMPMEAFHLVCEAFVQACEANIDDDGGLAIFFETCQGCWRDILNASDLQQRWELYQWFAENAQNSRWNCGDDEVENFLLSGFHDREFLEANLKLLDT